MKIPITGRKKALIVVDVQKTFVLDRNKYILSNIRKVIENIYYDIIICTISHNEKKSLWFYQTWWDEWLEKEDVDSRILKSLEGKEYKVARKLSKSAFKWDLDLHQLFQKRNIEEVHIVWFESHDCVYATAQEAFDFWYYVFVIEEATETWSTKANHKKAIDLLNYQNLTNNSDFVWNKNTKFIIL